MRAARLLRLLGGTLLLLAGLVILPLPVPVGLPMALAGLGLLVAVSPQMRDAVCAVRRRWPRFSRRLDRLAPRLPRPLARLIRSTAPEAHEPRQ